MLRSASLTLHPKLMNIRRAHTWKVLLGPLVVLLLLALTPAVATAQTEDGGSPERREIAMHYSLYYENFKNENYQAALPDLRWILENAPTFPQGDDRNYERAVKAYGALAKQAQDEAAKQAYLDSALALIENAVPALEAAGAEVDPYAWTLKKGRFLQMHQNALPEMRDEMLAAYRKAYQMAPQDMDAYYLDLILRAYVSADKKEEAIAFMDQLEQQRGDEEEVSNLLAKWGARVFTEPAERVAYLEGIVAENPEDAEAMTELFQLYMRQNMREEASQLAEQLLAQNPSPDLLRTIAKMQLEDGQAQQAFELYQQAIEASDEPASAEVFYNMGLALQRMGQLSKARTYFRKALDADPAFGRAHLAIGDLYASAVAQCASRMEWTDRAVYWAAVDQYQQAKSVDPSIASVANQKISTYRQYFPSQEKLFFGDLQEGQSYTIDYGCYAWIGETTTVRAQ